MKKLLILAILLLAPSAWAAVAMVGTPTTGATVSGCHSLVGATTYTCTRSSSTVGNWLLITVRYSHQPSNTTVYPIVPIVYPAGIALSTGDYPIPLFSNPVAPAFLVAGNQATGLSNNIQAWAVRVFTGGSVTATVTLTGIPNLTGTRGVDISISEISGADPDIPPTVWNYAGSNSGVTTIPQSISGITSGDLVVSYIGGAGSVNWTCTASWTCTNGTAHFDFASWITATGTSQSNSTVVQSVQNANIIVDFAQPNASIARYTSANSGDWNTNANWTCSATGPCTNLHPATTTDVVNITAGKAMLCTVSTTCNFGQLYQYGGSLENAGTLVGNSSATAGQLLWVLRSSGTSNAATFTNDPGATMSTIGNAGVDNAAVGAGVLISLSADPGPSNASSNFVYSGTWTLNGVLYTANHSHLVPQAGSILNIGTTTTTTTGYRISTSGDNGLETGEADGVNSCLGSHPPTAWTSGNFATIQTLASSNQQAYIDETSYGSLFKSCYIKLLGLGDNNHASVTAGGWDTDPADGIAGHVMMNNSTQFKYWRAPNVNGTGVFHIAGLDVRPIKLGNVAGASGGVQLAFNLSPGYYDPTISRYIRHSTFAPATGSGVTYNHGAVDCDANGINNNRCNGIEFSDNVLMTGVDYAQWHGADNGTPALHQGNLWMRYDFLNSSAFQDPLVYSSYLCNQLYDSNIEIAFPGTGTLSHWLEDRGSNYCTEVATSSDSNRIGSISNNILIGYPGSTSTDGMIGYSYTVDNVNYVDSNNIFDAFNVPAPVHAMVDHYDIYYNHSGAGNSGFRTNESQYTSVANTNALVAWFRYGISDIRVGGMMQGSQGQAWVFPQQDGWVQCDVISPTSETGTTVTLTTQNCKDGTGTTATLATNQFATIENLSDPNCAFLNHWSAVITVVGSTVTFTAGNHASPVTPTNPTCSEANGSGKISVGMYYDRNNFTNLVPANTTNNWNRAFNAATNLPGSLSLQASQASGDYKRISAAVTVTTFTNSASFGVGAGNCTGVIPGDYVIRAIDSTPTPNYNSPIALITAVDASCNLTLGPSNLSTTTIYNGIDGPGGPWTITAGTTTIYFFVGFWNNGYYGDGKEGHAKYETAITPLWANPGVNYVDWYNKVTGGSGTCSMGTNPASTCTPYAGLRDNAICYNGLALDGVTTCTFNSALHWWYLGQYLLQNYRKYQGGFSNSVRDRYDPTTGIAKYSDNGSRTILTCPATAPCAGQVQQLQVFPAAII